MDPIHEEGSGSHTPGEAEVNQPAVDPPIVDLPMGDSVERMATAIAQLAEQ